MIADKRILVVVPARGGSKGIKLKNIRPLNGVPLVALVGEVVKQLPYVDRAVVSTDHPEIAKVAEESGLGVPFMRPESLSGDLVADAPVLKHALLECERIDKQRYDIIIMLQPTSPFRKPEYITAAVNKMIDGGYDAVWTVSETDAKAHPLKQLVIKDDRLDYYDPVAVDIIARQQLEPLYHKNGVAYVLARDLIADQETIKGKKTSYLVIDDIMVNIDTEFDFKLAEFVIQNM